MSRSAVLVYLQRQAIAFLDGAFEILRSTLLAALKIYLVGLFLVAGTAGTVVAVQEVADAGNSNVLELILQELQRLREEVESAAEQIPD